jgi:DNA replication protein DnaC
MTTKSQTNGRVWSTSDIYLHPSPLSSMPPRMIPMSTLVASRRFTQEFVEAFLAETQWDLIDDLARLTPGDLARIVNHGAPCPVCEQGRNWRRHRGQDTGLVICMEVDHGCRRHIQIGNMWRKVMPELRYRHIRLDDLEPSSLSLLPKEKQQEYIDILREKREASVFLGGKSGGGKTHLSIALLFDAVERWYLAWEEDPALCDQSVFWIEHTGEFLEQIYNSNQSKPRLDVEPPLVTVREIRRLRKLGHKVTLVLDEFGRFNPTDYRMDALQQLLAAVYLGHGQVIAVSNETLSDLEKKWAGFFAGESIERRLCGPEANGGHYLRFSGPK